MVLLLELPFNSHLTSPSLILIFRAVNIASSTDSTFVAGLLWQRKRQATQIHAIIEETPHLSRESLHRPHFCMEVKERQACSAMQAGVGGSRS